MSESEVEVKKVYVVTRRNSWGDVDVVRSFTDEEDAEIFVDTKSVDDDEYEYTESDLDSDLP